MKSCQSKQDVAKSKRIILDQMKLHHAILYKIKWNQTERRLNLTTKLAQKGMILITVGRPSQDYRIASDIL